MIVTLMRTDTVTEKDGCALCTHGERVIVQQEQC